MLRLRRYRASDSILYTDSGWALGCRAGSGYVHLPINRDVGVRVVGKVYHVQNVSAYDGRLKEWMRRFHGIATITLPITQAGRRLIDRAHGALYPRCHACRVGYEWRSTINDDMAKMKQSSKLYVFEKGDPGIVRNVEYFPMPASLGLQSIGGACDTDKLLCMVFGVIAETSGVHCTPGKDGVM